MQTTYSSERIGGFGETVFAKYTRLAAQHQAVNLGQGFPDFAPPAFVMDALAEALLLNQQYAPLPGVPALLEAVARKASVQFKQDIHPQSEVQIVVGATEGLFACMQAFVNPGDEVILLEPFYDAYPADVIMAGGVPRYVPLLPQADGSWQLDFDELARAFTNKTKLMVLNTPHNPTGKVFTPDELDRIIALAQTYDALIISDEVYEHIAFTPHVSLASRPGGFERCLSISSIGKSFSVTGWKVGWVVGPAELIQAVRMAHQWIPFVVATPLQHACARVLESAAHPENTYYAELTKQYQAKRDLLMTALQATPFRPLNAQGSYFVMADSSALNYKDDVALCEDLPARVGVGAIPPSAFYCDAHKYLAKHLVRFAFCKSDEALKKAGVRLQGLNK